MDNDLMSAAGLIHIIEESRQNALKKVNRGTYQNVLESR